MEYVVLWDGSHRGVDADLFCQIEEPRKAEPFRPLEAMPRDDARATRNWQDREVEKQAVLDLLATRERWRVCALRDELRMPRSVFYGVIQRLKQHGLIRSVDHGSIAVRQNGQAA